MGKKVFIDTWGWISLYNKRESKHNEVKNWYFNFRSQGGIIYTTDYILDETFTLLFRRTASNIAAKAMMWINESIEKGYINLERITAERFERSKESRIKYLDKPLISFTDLTSVVIMSEEDIEYILTEDNHFIYMEAGFQKIQLT